MYAFYSALPTKRQVINASVNSFCQRLYGQGTDLVKYNYVACTPRRTPSLNMVNEQLFLFWVETGSDMTGKLSVLSARVLMQPQA